MSVPCLLVRTVILGRLFISSLKKKHVHVLAGLIRHDPGLAAGPGALLASMMSVKNACLSFFDFGRQTSPLLMQSLCQVAAYQCDSRSPVQQFSVCWNFYDPTKPMKDQTARHRPEQNTDYMLDSTTGPIYVQKALTGYSQFLKNQRYIYIICIHTYLCTSHAEELLKHVP